MPFISWKKALIGLLLLEAVASGLAVPPSVNLTDSGEDLAIRDDETPSQTLESRRADPQRPPDDPGRGGRMSAPRTTGGVNLTKFLGPPKPPRPPRQKRNLDVDAGTFWS